MSVMGDSCTFDYADKDRWPQPQEGHEASGQLRLHLRPPVPRREPVTSAEKKLEAVREIHWGFKGGRDPSRCEDPECSLCGVLLCPHHDMMHLHHDGCPAECLVHEREPECGPACRHHDYDPGTGCPHACEHKFGGSAAECLRCGARVRSHDRGADRCWCGAEGGTRGHVWGYDG